MENNKLEMADETISAIVNKIIDTRPKNGDEPFSSEKSFWENGFHRKAFLWLTHDIAFALRKRNPGYGDDPCANFQRRLNDDIDKVGMEIAPIPKQFETLAKDARWCDYKYLRKAVLCRLFKRSFPHLGPPINDKDHLAKSLEYPEWLPSKWIREVKP